MESTLAHLLTVLPRRVRGHRLARLISAATFGTLIGGLSGALLPFAISAVYPDRGVTDAYFLAAGTALFVVSTISTSIEGVIVPFAFQHERRGTAALDGFLRQVSLQAGLAASGSGAVGALVFAELIVPNSAFSSQAQHTCQLLLLLLIPLPGLVAASAAFSGGLYVYRRFGVPPLTQSFRSAGGLLALLAGYRVLGVYAVPIGLALGELGRLLYLRHRYLAARAVTPGSGPAATRAFWHAAVFQVVSLSLVGSNPLVDKIFAARLHTGDVTTLELAEKFFYMPATLLSSGVVVVLGANWADQIARRAPPRMVLRHFHRWLVVMSVASCVTAVIAIAVLDIALSPVADDVHVHSPSTLIAAFTMLALGLPLFVGGQLCARFLIACGRTTFLPVIAAISAGSNFVGDWFGMHVAGVVGIAAASTVTRGVVLIVALVFAALAGASLSTPPRETTEVPAQ